MKISIIGAGAVGASCCDYVYRKKICDELVLLDIKKGLAEGKAMDMNQCAHLIGTETFIVGVTGDYSRVADSDIVVITSGIPRKPGMTREELIGTNATIVTRVTESITKCCANPVIVVVSNPMDSMSYLAVKTSGLSKYRIIGMGGILDSSRFKYRLKESLGRAIGDLQAMVIGGHGDSTMVPLMSLASYQGLLMKDLMTDQQREDVVRETMTGGATLTKLLGTSAWYAPGSAVAELVEAIVHDKKKLLPCSVLAEGEYGLKDLCIGLPVVVGKEGWEAIEELPIDSHERKRLEESAEQVHKMNQVLADLNLLR